MSKSAHQKIGESEMQFGKYKGMLVKDVPLSYMRFATENHRRNRENQEFLIYAREELSRERIRNQELKLQLK